MAEPLPELLQRDDEVSRVARALAESGSFALDLEFVSEGRYIPELALVQVAWREAGSDRVAALDPLAADPAPVFEQVADERVEVVVHAARQDLSLLFERFDVCARGLWDTQIAAAFAGLGEQLGYARLCRRLLDVSLDKSHQYTDWLCRPLPQEKLRYALDDVRYLLPAWQALRRILEERGRLPWVREESDRRAEEASERRPPEAMYRHVGGAGGLRGSALGALRTLAAWREREARRSNKPPSWILPDGALVELSRRRVSSERDLRRARGVGQGTVKRYGAAILEAIASGVEDESTERPAARPGLSETALAWASVVTSLVQARCAAEDLPPRFVGSRADAEDVVRFFEGNLEEAEVRLLAGWRRQVVGDQALAWLSGELSLVACAGAPGGLQLTPRT